MSNQHIDYHPFNPSSDHIKQHADQYVYFRNLKAEMAAQGRWTRVGDYEWAMAVFKTHLTKAVAARLAALGVVTPEDRYRVRVGYVSPQFDPPYWEWWLAPKEPKRHPVRPEPVRLGNA